MNTLKITIMIIFLTTILSAKQFKIEFVKAIGDDRDTHTFFKLSGAVISGNKDIFVVDQAGHFIAKYNWEGNLVKRTGQKGQGPKDLGTVNFLTIFGNKLYLYDHTNSRIVEMDLDLNILEYIKVRYKFFRYAFPIKNQHFLGDYFSIRQDTGRIGIIDKDGERILHFFEKLPIKDINWKDRMKLMKLSPYSTIGMDVSPERDQVLIYFYYPTNPVEIFVYNVKGDSIKTLKYKTDEKYQFPEHFLEFKPKYPTPYHYLNVYSAFFYKDNYIAFYRETSQVNEKEQKADDFYLIFNSDGKLIQKAPLDKPVGFYYLSPEGYLLGSGTENEIEKLYIYRIKHVK